MNWRWLSAFFVAFGLAVFGSRIGAFELSIPGDQDASLYMDIENVTSKPAVGDFDGDGVNDLVVPYGFGEGIFIFLGGPWSKIEAFSNRAYFHVKVPSQTGSSPPLLADLDGDHKQELIFKNASNSWPGGGVSNTLIVVRGRGFESTRLIDLGVPPPPDLIINLTPDGVWSDPAVGDIDGDGKMDLVIGSRSAQPWGRTNAGACYVFWGQSALPTGRIDLVSAPKLTTIAGKIGEQLGSAVSAQDLDQNGKTDLLVDGNIFYGIDPFPGTWDLSITSADVRIQGGNSYLPVGDTNGDHLSEIFVTSGSWPIIKYFMMDGQAFDSERPLIDLTPGSPNFVPNVPISFPYNSFGIYLTGFSWGDFDGDHLSDLFFSGLPPSGGPVVFGVLSSARGTVPPVAISTPSMILQFPSRNFVNQILKDVNHDGRDDFISFERFEFARPPGISYSAVHFLFGFVPLETPSIKIIPRSPPSLQVSLSLRVDGQPTEMMVGGDMSDSFKDQWIPYQNTLSATLLPSAGSKTVQAKFRNSYFRESLLASDSWELALDPSRIMVVTNRLERDGGRKARFECHITETSSVDAVVLDSNGGEVRDLGKSHPSPGVLTLEWDGMNNAGRRVVPGVYYMVIKVNDLVRREKIVVRG